MRKDMFQHSTRSRTAVWTAGLVALLNTAVAVGEPVAAAILRPRPFQIIQREPSTVGRGRAGTGACLLQWTAAAPSAAVEWRLVALPQAFGTGTSWATARPSVSGTVCSASVALPAGGWYRLEVRHGTETASVEPVGVGELFLIAGQSYAANCNEERLAVSEPQKRVACLDPKTGAWRVADDPQPGANDHKGGGSIWPPFGDELAARLKVPVGWADVAIGGTASQQWLPGGELHKSLVLAAGRLGAFRAVLWQQGESDVMAGTTADRYVANLTAIRAALVSACGFAVPWLPAKSTHHPTVYDNPKQEAVIRSAVDTLWKTEGFFPGPDTDRLTGDHRGGPASKQHFSAKGQRAAGAMWVEAVSRLTSAP